MAIDLEHIPRGDERLRQYFQYARARSEGKNATQSKEDALREAIQRVSEGHESIHLNIWIPSLILKHLLLFKVPHWIPVTISLLDLGVRLLLPCVQCLGDARPGILSFLQLCHPKVRDPLSLFGLRHV
jgi:hypothetical protein